MTSDFDDTRWREEPADPASTARVADTGLQYRVLDHDDPGDGAWLQAVRRGFQDGEASDDDLPGAVDRNRFKRRTGVYDAQSPTADAPVATIASWPAEVTVPGGGTLSTCAISAVTVAPTHRRRGLARALLEGELRTAAGAGLPLATLTVTEATIYGRYGFAPAADVASIEIDTTRARWAGPVPAGRVDFIARADAAALVRELRERERTAAPGEITLPQGYEHRFSGTVPGDKEGAKVRVVRYADPDGVAQGVATYTVSENSDDFTRGTVDVRLLTALTDDAYAALWRFFIELDLVARVRAPLRSVDEPVLWMINDRRGARVQIEDHHWIRILDVPATLAGRAYAVDADVVLHVDDPLGLGAGAWTLHARADAPASVTRVDEATDAAADPLTVHLGVAELGALLLGSVSAVTLARAGRLRTTDPAALARVFAWPEPARLAIWY